MLIKKTILLLLVALIANHTAYSSNLTLLKQKLKGLQPNLKGHSIVSIYEKGKPEAFAVSSDRYRPSDQFMIGSVSKHMTSYMLLKTLEQNFKGQKLEQALNMKLRRVLPNSKLLQQINKSWGGKISLTDLLTHHSGLSDYMDDLNSNKTKFNKHVNALQILKQVKFNNSKKYQYSNSNYLLIGKLIEELTGQRFEHSFNRLIKSKAKLGNSSAPTKGNYNKLISKTNFKNLVPNLNSEVYIDLSNALGTGGVISTEKDLKRWLDFLQSPATRRVYKIMTQNYGRDDDGDKVNFGLFTTSTSFGELVNHQGGIDSFSSFIGFIPKKITIIVLSNNPQDSNIIFEALNSIF